MSIETAEELEGLRRAGAVVAEALRAARRLVRPGVTTAAADACVTVPAGRVDARSRRLAVAAQAALKRGLGAAGAGARVNAMGRAVSGEASGRGFSVCAELTGHGIGRRIHEPPDVPNVFLERASRPLHAGLVLTVEPILSAGRGDVLLMPDGWTV